jgi:uncharacterized membrane protein HdeD (DUF308 family)
MTEEKNIVSHEILEARQGSQDSVVFGFIMSILGIFTVLAPFIAGMAVTFMIGILLIVAGITGTIFAFTAESFGKGVLKFLFGALGIVSGIIIISIPEHSLGILTYILAVFFLATGITDIVFSVQARTEDGWGWALFNGIISILLGIMIVAQWPVSGVYAVGIYVGVRIMMQGWAMIALGSAGRWRSRISRIPVSKTGKP